MKEDNRIIYLISTTANGHGLIKVFGTSNVDKILDRTMEELREDISCAWIKSPLSLTPGELVSIKEGDITLQGIFIEQVSPPHLARVLTPKGIRCKRPAELIRSSRYLNLDIEMEDAVPLCDAPKELGADKKLEKLLAS